MSNLATYKSLHQQTEIQNIIDQVRDLFTYGKEVDSPTIAKLNEKLWKEFADKNGYHYVDRP